VKAADDKVLRRARKTLELEARAIEKMIPRLGKDFLLPVMATTFTPTLLRVGKSCFISSVSPLDETATSTSSGVMAPRSP
jgi:hypothetical protein